MCEPTILQNTWVLLSTRTGVAKYTVWIIIFLLWPHKHSFLNRDHNRKPWCLHGDAFSCGASKKATGCSRNKMKIKRTAGCLFTVTRSLWGADWRGMRLSADVSHQSPASSAYLPARWINPRCSEQIERCGWNSDFIRLWAGLLNLHEEALLQHMT